MPAWLYYRWEARNRTLLALIGAMVLLPFWHALAWLQGGAPPDMDGETALRVLRALRSPFEIDIYVWLTWRFFRLRKPVAIPWASLALQFGSGYANPRHFKKRFLGYLKSVIDYYPEVRLESTAAGLLLRPSPTHVEPRMARR